MHIAATWSPWCRAPRCSCPDAGVDPAIASELTTAAAGFLSGPGTLRLQIKPKQPFGVLSAMAAPITKDSLGFSATFTPSAAPEPATN